VLIINYNYTSSKFSCFQNSQNNVPLQMFENEYCPYKKKRYNNYLQQKPVKIRCSSKIFFCMDFKLYKKKYFQKRQNFLLLIKLYNVNIC